MTGVELIAQERQRQIDKEGYSAQHDDEHDTGDLAMASLCYISDFYSRQAKLRAYYYNFALDHWPWDEHDWKPTPKDDVRQLVKAGALIAAEIDRLQRI